MIHRIYHGCGHFVIQATYKFDYYDEYVEFWMYLK